VLHKQPLNSAVAQRSSALHATEAKDRYPLGRYRPQGMVGMSNEQGKRTMPLDFSSIHNHHEQAVFGAVNAQSAQFPLVATQPELLADVACIALNRLPPRYIRHSIDYSFYLSDGERERDEKAMAEAVIYAFGYVQARSAMRARG
jgi:hypothetical protein